MHIISGGLVFCFHYIIQVYNPNFLGFFFSHSNTKLLLCEILYIIAVL